MFRMFEIALHNLRKSIFACGMICVGVCLAPQLGHADFDWFNDITNRVAYADGLAPVPGHMSDPTAAAYVQLIWAGPDGTNNPAVNTGDGTTGDDEVHSKTWMGRASFGDNDGYVLQFETFGADVSGYYYVRVWTAPASDYDQGGVPTAATNFYGDSRLWLNPELGLPINPDEFNFGGEGDGNNIGFAADRQPNADTDADGMPDWWEFLFFTNITSLADGQTDHDMDGQRDLYEFITKTIPTDDHSLFEMEGIEAGSSTVGPVIKWQSATGAVYTVSRTTNILMNSSLQSLTTGVAATPPQNCYTDSVSAAAAYIYVISVEN